MDKPKSSKEISNATRWSFITELISKLITPILNMILARILLPEAFGVVAVVNMVLAFSDIFAVAGLQKFIVQHQYKDGEELNQSLSVVFWTNIGLSLIIWGLISVFNLQIANILGEPSYGIIIVVACFSLPIKSLSCAQEALCVRRLEFKRLFFNRLFASLIPLLVTIPLALFGMGFWSLVIGHLASDLLKTLYLNISSTWKPKFFFKFSLLAEMFSFGFWSLLESLTIWGCTWFDIFIISNSLGEYHTGIYRTSQSNITGIFALFTAGTASVLYSSLSRIQNDNDAFKNLYYSFQKNLAIIVIPIGVGVFVFKAAVTRILLGSNWNDATDLIGIWGLCTALVSAYGTLSRETYRAKGIPHISVIVQVLHLIFVIPLSIMSLQYGFEVFIYIRSFAFLQIILLHFLAVKIVMNISPLKILAQSLIPICGSVSMGLIGYIFLQTGSGLFHSILGIIICVVFYGLFLSLFPSYRMIILNTLKTFKAKR